MRTAELEPLTLGTEQPATASMLLREGRCTAMCLLAVEPTKNCACPCKGIHHGALAATLVPGTTRQPRPDPCDEPGLFPLPRKD